jgi:2-hydroxy-3-oxopropionate reductase
MKTIGYLGLGVMGFGMTTNLIQKSGSAIYGYDPLDAARRRFAENGGKPVSSAEELYRACDIICMCLPTNAIVKTTLTEIMKTARPGTILVDMGSTSPYLIREMYQKARENGFYLLDSPVSGGETGADSGTLTIMCGGDREIFDEVEPYLEMMGRTVTYMGPSGCGSTAKVANNMMVGIHLAAMDEAFAFAVKAGLDPHKLFSAIKGGFAQSAVMDLKVPKILRRDFSASARIAVHLKDLNNAMEMAEHLKIELPMTEIVREQMEYMKEHGMIDEDQCALIKYYEHTMGVEVQ